MRRAVGYLVVRSRLHGCNPLKKAKHVVNDKEDKMDKKAKQIRVTEEDWKSVRVAAVKAGLSTGDYLVGLHKSSIPCHPQGRVASKASPVGSS